jgi:hypothetical protein
MSGVQPPVGVDVVPRVPSAVLAGRVVRREEPEALMFASKILQIHRDLVMPAREWMAADLEFWSRNPTTSLK